METSGDVLGSPPSGRGRRSPCPSQEGQHWALSKVMCPGWLVPCLIYVWGQRQSMTHSPSLSNLNVHSKCMSLPAARPCPLSVRWPIWLLLTSLLVCHTDFLSVSAFLSVYLVLASVYMSVWLFVGQVCTLARKSVFAHTVWMHELVRATDHALEI